VPRKIAGISPFKVVYGVDPLGPLDLIPMPLDQKPSTNAKEKVQVIKRCMGKNRKIQLGLFSLSQQA